jgi:membrane protein implicated in regulation of membrane protease activity
MKLLKFLFTARMSFILFALLAFVFTVLYVTWANRHQTSASIHDHHSEMH